MDLISLLVIVLVALVILYIVNAYLPVEPGLKRIIMLVLVVILVIYIATTLVGGTGALHFR